MTTQFTAKPPSPMRWRDFGKHFKLTCFRFGRILLQAIQPFNPAPDKIEDFPDPQTGTQVTESHVKQAQWIFDQAETRRERLEQKAQSTFSLMLFLVPFLASLFVLVVSKGTTSRAFAFTLALTILSSIFLLLAFISAVRAVAVKSAETLFLDSVIHESGQFRKYDESFHARGLLYCASINTGINDHIAQFVKGAHILSATAVLTLLFAAIPSVGLFMTPASPVQTQIVGPVNLTVPDMAALRADVASLKSDIQKLSNGKVSQEDFKSLGDKVGKLDTKLAEIQKTRTNPATKVPSPSHSN